jgi:hypothetical protein
LGVGLVVAAGLYVLFAALANDPRGLVLEASGVALFGALAAVGGRESRYVLAAGWVLHVLWDVELHPAGFAGYAPRWYPAVCLSFDLIVAGYLILAVPAAAGLRTRRAATNPFFRPSVRVTVGARDLAGLAGRPQRRRGMTFAKCFIGTLAVSALITCGPRPVVRADTGALVGTWRGTSVCTAVRPACHDEIAVYHVAPARRPTRSR